MKNRRVSFDTTPSASLSTDHKNWSQPRPTNSKIITGIEELQTLVSNLRKQHKLIALTQGSFDLLHIGHARYCQQAKSYADILIIGLDSDLKVKRRKGENRPLIPENERAEMLTHLIYVDFVIIKDANWPKWQLIKTIKPDFLITTVETYTQKQLQQLQQLCKAVKVLQPMATTSTSAKLRLMQIHIAKKVEEKLQSRLLATINQVIEEIRNE